MGGVQNLLEKMPLEKIGIKAPQDLLDSGISEQFFLFEAIIYSMTYKERRFPALIQQASRKKRIASGAGVSSREINLLVKNFEKLQRQLSRFSRVNMQKMLSQSEENEI